MGSQTMLVTGATGFTGGHLVRALLGQGHRVRALARSSAGTRRLMKAGVEVVPGDLLDDESVDRAVQGVDRVYHLAAAYRAAKHPDSYYFDVNVGGTERILGAARRHGVRRVVHCSTVGVHGEITSIPAREDAPFDPDDVYQRSKLEGELKASEAFANGLPGVVFRPVGIYGPGDTRFLKLFKTIHNRTFRMFGSGEVLYHLTYIDDLVDGILRCGDRAEALGETYILAGERYVTLNELVGLVAEAVERPVPRGRLPLGPLKVMAAVCEGVCRPLGIEPPLHRRRLDFFVKDRAFASDKAKQELGFEPSVGLAEGLRRTAEWYFAEGHLSPAGRQPGHAA